MSWRQAMGATRLVISSSFHCCLLFFESLRSRICSDRRSFLTVSSLSVGALAFGAAVTAAAPVSAPAVAEAEAPAAEAYANSLNFRTRKNIIPLPKFSAQKVARVPDSKLTRETRGLLREYSTPLLINHSHRAFFWANEFGHQSGKTYDRSCCLSARRSMTWGCWRSSAPGDRFEVDARMRASVPGPSEVPDTRSRQRGTRSRCIRRRVSGLTSRSRWNCCTTVWRLDLLGIGYEGLAEVRDKVVAEFPRDFHARSRRRSRRVSLQDEDHRGHLQRRYLLAFDAQLQA